MSITTACRWVRWLALGIAGLTLWAALPPTGRTSGMPLRLGYSDWPGWVAWQIAIDKGWLRQAGLDVSFDWFDYSSSIDAFTAGRLDGNFMTNGDALVAGAAGARNLIVMVTDYSNGNDMIVARPGIRTLQELKGRKIGVEIGLVEHLLLLEGLKEAGMSPQDVTLVNTKTNETPQVLASGQVDAVGAWQPNSGLAMRTVPGAHPVYSSAQAPGMIYDVLAVRPASLAAHRAQFLTLIRVWQRVVDYINDPKTRDDAVSIMAARVGLGVAQYQRVLAGTHLIGISEGKKVFIKTPGLQSLYGSCAYADQFNVRNAVYQQPQRIDAYVEPALMNAVQ
jgi:NitT/TauT family transport system substrate-binding protein